MKMSGSQIIQAPRQVVWKGLNDPKILQQSIPGCETIDAASPTEMSAKVVLKIGPVKASFKGAVTLSDINALRRVTGFRARAKVVLQALQVAVPRSS